LTKAYEATRKVFSDHLNRKSGFDAQLLETAKNSLVFLLIDDLKSVSSMSAYSMSCLFKGVGLGAVPELFERIQRVEMGELKRLLKAYIMPMFCDENANCLVVCHPAKSDGITKEFSQR
jgi:predicted Zn-dependent peptidase